MLKSDELVSSSASAGSTESLVPVYKYSRPFIIRFGIGIGTALRDMHNSMTEEFWGAAGDNAPFGMIIGSIGNIATGIITAGVCAIIAALSPYTFGAIILSWPAIIFALLPVEIVALNVVINFIGAVPSIFQAIGKGIFDAGKFIAKEVSMRIPNE